MSSRQQTFSPSGMVSTTKKGPSKKTIETETGGATVTDLLDQMSHRQQ